MAKGTIYEYAILFHPKSKDNEENNAAKSELLGDVTRVVATSEQEVAILASREIPEQYLGKLEQVEIAIRPF